jgi:hypothetical protein
MEIAAGVARIARHLGGLRGGLRLGLLALVRQRDRQQVLPGPAAVSTASPKLVTIAWSTHTVSTQSTDKPTIFPYISDMGACNCDC